MRQCGTSACDGRLYSVWRILPTGTSWQLQVYLFSAQESSPWSVDLVIRVNKRLTLSISSGGSSSALFRSRTAAENCTERSMHISYMCDTVYPRHYPRDRELSGVIQTGGRHERGASVRRETCSLLCQHRSPGSLIWQLQRYNVIGKR